MHSRVADANADVDAVLAARSSQFLFAPFVAIWISVDIHLASRCAPDQNQNRCTIIIAFKHEIATSIT